MTKYFGTDGIRMKLTDMSEEFVVGVAQGVAAPLRVKGASVVIGCDTRSSCRWISDVFKDVFLKNGIKVIDVGIVPTAALSFLVADLSCALGVMITASHNTAEWNGIKIFNSEGKKLMQGEIEGIEREMDRVFSNHVRAKV